MKTTIKSSMFFFSISVALLLSIIPVNAVNIHFTGKNLTNNSFVNPDSIRIVNVNQKKSFVMVNKYDFNLTTFTSVDTVNYNYTDEGLITKVTNNFITFYSNEHEIIQVSINNLTGEILFNKNIELNKGETEMDFEGREMPIGFYLMNIKTSRLNRTIKLLKINEMFYQKDLVAIPNTKAVENKFEILGDTSDTYNFYGYWKKSIDSIKNMIPIRDTTLNFNFFDSFSFSKGEFEIKGLRVLIGERSTTSDPLNGPVTTYSEFSKTFSFSYELINSRLGNNKRDQFLSYGCNPCSHFQTINDTFTFCYEYLYEKLDDNGLIKSCKTTSVICVIDTANKLITNLQLIVNSQYDPNNNTTGGYKVIESNTFGFQNIPISSIENGRITCILEKNTLSNVFINNSLSIHSEDIQHNRFYYPFYSRSSSVVEVLEFTPDASLKFTLTP